MRGAHEQFAAAGMPGTSNQEFTLNMTLRKGQTFGENSPPNEVTTTLGVMASDKQIIDRQAIWAAITLASSSGPTSSKPATKGQSGIILCPDAPCFRDEQDRRISRNHNDASHQIIRRW